MSQKPTIHLDLNLERPEPGGIGDILAQLLNRETFQDRYDLRHPLGIYNVSTSRISGRLARAAGNVANYMLQNPELDRTSRDGAHLDRICDDIESCIYAAAEHVDDLESCLLCLFPDRHRCSKNRIVRDFKLGLTPIRRNMSAFANLIKHQQARVRLYQLGFQHNGQPMTLIGFFIEGVKEGTIGPSTVHGDDQLVSVASFFWEVILFVHRAADILASAVGQLAGLCSGPPDRARWPIIREGLIASAKVPNFALDGSHPFDSVNISLRDTDSVAIFSDKDLYGSLGNRWSLSEDHAFTGSSLGYSGDGVSKSFKLVDPKQVQLKHWK